MEPADRDAVLAHVALKKLHPAVIIEIACVLCPEELLAVRRAYQARYQHSLEEDVAAHTTGDMRKASNTTLLHHFNFLIDIIMVIVFIIVTALGWLSECI